MPGIYTRIEKYASVPVACLGAFVTHTVEIENIGIHPLTDIVFSVAVPQGLSFVPESVEINGERHPNANPNQGIQLSDIMPGITKEISFIAKATHVPPDNPAINVANVDFRTISHEDLPVNTREISNPVPVTVKDCDCDEGTCERALCKIYSVSLPFTVKPFARKKTPDIVCHGEMRLHEGHKPCPNPQHKFDYTLTQQIKVELPVAFGAEVCYEEPCAKDEGECDKQLGI